jgi:DNA repair exonuclease SbcCD ATPase subunit
MALKPYLLFVFLGFFCFLTLSPALAQMTRQERRGLRKELRRMSPEDLDRMREQEAAMQDKISDLSRRTSQLQDEIQGKDKQITSLKNDIVRLETELKNRTQEVRELRDKDEQWDRGVVFRVQIGAFKDYDFQDVVGSSPQLKYEEDSNWQKYIMGNFRDYDEADKLKKHLRRTGVRDAWIVPYEDGKRVPLKEVLDKVLKQRQN